MKKEIVISTTSREIFDALLSLKIPEAKQNEVKKYGGCDRISAKQEIRHV